MLNKRLTKQQITENLLELGIKSGDTLLVRVNLGSIGRINRNDFLDALLEVVGLDGTIASLAYTSSYTTSRADPHDYFYQGKATYAGAFPQLMIEHISSVRSSHPMCSMVAIGKNAEKIIKGHDAFSPAYEPIRTLMNMNAKGILIGCVKSSPGFTTAHLAEYDLGLYKRVILPWITSIFYKDNRGQLTLFRRKDMGLCSMSYMKFYSYYLQEGILSCCRIGNANSILVPLIQSYNIEYSLLKSNPKFNICDDKLCITCNLRRWDRIHKIPGTLMKYLLLRIKTYWNSK